MYLSQMTDTKGETIKVLAIGDPHFKADNAVETDLMTIQLKELCEREKPTIIVVLGDILHTHEKLAMLPVKRAIAFLRTLRPLSSHLYVLIGNHDRLNNNEFQTDNHAFGALEEWPQTTVVDKTKIASVGSSRMVFVPYVPPGRLAEALSSVDLKVPYTGITAVFAHQEFKGAKMGAITSNVGDPWPQNYPLCVSGHIHDFDELRPNLIYTGTPIQHGFADTRDKTVSLFTFSFEDSKWSLKGHKRVALKIPKKLRVTLTPAQLSEFKVPVDAHIKIKVKGSAITIKEIMKLPHVMALSKTPGVTIVIEDTTVSKAGSLPLPSDLGAVRTRTSFHERLLAAVKSEASDVQTAYHYLFG
jgi:DNA repair exonuclease SbcCD nuclease subunit